VKCDQAFAEALSILLRRGFITYESLRESYGPCALPVFNRLLRSGLAVKASRGLLVSADTRGFQVSDLKATIELCNGRGDCVYELLRTAAREADRVIRTLVKKGALRVEGVSGDYLALWLEYGWPSEVPAEGVRGEWQRHFAFAGSKAVMVRPPWAVEGAVVRVER